MSQIQEKKLKIPNIDPKKSLSDYDQIEKMISGLPYVPNDISLTNGRAFANMMCQKLNKTTQLEKTLRFEILQELFGTCSSGVYIEPPFFCDYGSNIHLGENVYMNYNCVLLDICAIKIGSGTMLAPGVQIYAATHPTDPIDRRSFELGKPITIGRDCWIGGNAIICPGVTIGDGSTIGAGSVVTKNVDSFVVVAGNPAKVIRRLEKRELGEEKKD